MRVTWLGKRDGAPAADSSRHDELMCRCFTSPDGVVELENCSEWRLVSTLYEPAQIGRGHIWAFFRRRRVG